VADSALEQIKVCTKCGEAKPLGDFDRNKNCLLGRSGRCKICTKICREATKEAQKARHKAWYAKNREKRIEQTKEYQKANPEMRKRAALKWHRTHPEASKAANAKFYQDNPQYSTLWKRAHPERAAATKRRFRERNKDNAKMRIDSAVSRGIRTSLNDNGTKGGRRWETLVGYTIAELMGHLERQFQPGMTWGNYGDWHIDHRIPLSVHNYESPDHSDFHRAWALTNLQPLWALDNIKKSAKLAAPFQPSLAI